MKCLSPRSESSLPQVNLQIHRQRSHWDLGMSVSFVADKQPQPGTGTDPGYTLAESPRSDHGALCEAMVRRARRIGIVVLTASLSMTTPLRLLLALTQVVKDITSCGRSMRAMCQLLRCWLMSVLNMKCSSSTGPSSGELSVE